ncbi:MAG: Mor transcription activator family protein [Phycisphaerales bacterium]
MSRIHENLDTGNLRASTSMRRQLEQFRSKVALLTRDDRLLITMYLDNGNSFRQISRLTGVNEVTISRRFEKIMHRLTNEYFDAAVKNRDKLSRRQMKIARDYFLRGVSIRQLKTKYRMSYHQVYQILKSVRELNRNTSVKVRQY